MALLTVEARELLELGSVEFKRRYRSLSPMDRRVLSAESARLEGIAQYPTPSSLANALDPTRLQTPLLDLIDKELVDVRDSVIVMRDRQRRLRELQRAGVDVRTATERAAQEIPEGGNSRLIISAPPQEGKSQLATRYFPLWLLRQFPGLRICIVSYDGDVAGTFGWQIRSDIELFDGSDGVIDLGLRLVTGQKAMSRWSLTSGGSMYCIGIGGGLTSKSVDLLIIDDPVKDMRAADSVIQSAVAWDWWFTVARPRLSAFAPVMELATRWHELDVAGRLITQQKDDEAAGVTSTDRWRVLNVPAQADHDPSRGEADVLGREPGEYLVSARGRTRGAWEATKNVTPPRYWSAQYQGRPTPGIGDILQRAWWMRYDSALVVRSPGGTFDVPGHDISQSWDMTFKDTKGTDYVVCEVWAKQGPNSFLLYVMRSRLDFPDTINSMVHVCNLFPTSRAKYVEDKANGPAVIAMLKKKIPGIIAVTPHESKTSRAEAASVYVRAGNFWLPTKEVASLHPEITFDVEGFIEECTAFDKGQHDDQVDAWSQYANEKYITHGAGKVISPVDRRVGRQAPRVLTPIEQRRAARVTQ